MSNEEEIARLNRELIGIQEMLAFVLLEVGEPVVVRKETLAKGLEDNMQIAIDDNDALDAFVFSLGRVENE